MRSPGTSNSQRASMTSRPLFISVAESTVIFGPIDQVGWRSASAGVTARRRSAGQPRKGPPEAVRTRRATSAGGRPSRHWWTALCSLSTGKDRDPAAARGLDHQAARHDQHFLVGQGDRLAGVDGGKRRLQRRRPRRRAEDDVHRGMGGHRGQPARAPAGGDGLRQALPLQLGERLRRRQRDDGRPVARRLRGQARGVGAGGETGDCEPVRVRVDDREGAPPDGAGRAEDGDVLHARLTPNQ